jgi:hypothetical protein
VRTPKRERAALRRSLRAAWGGFWVAKGFTRELSAFFAERLTRTSDAAAQRAAMAAAMALRRDGREMFRS